MCYCKCAKSDVDNLEQLMRNAWYPATVTDPGTCATFQSLESYRMYNVVGNLNVWDYITALERFTDSTASSGMTWQLVSDLSRCYRMVIDKFSGPISTIPENGPAVGRLEATEAIWKGA
jgi:hypothetical protein